MNANKILSNLLSSILKEDDASCSASTHLNTAIAELSRQADWESMDQDYKDLVIDAREEMSLLHQDLSPLPSSMRPS